MFKIHFEEAPYMKENKDMYARVYKKNLRRKLTAREVRFRCNVMYFQNVDIGYTNMKHIPVMKYLIFVQKYARTCTQCDIHDALTG